MPVKPYMFKRSTNLNRTLLTIVGVMLLTHPAGIGNVFALIEPRRN